MTGIPFLDNFGPKNQNCQFKLKFVTKTNSNMENSIHFFCFWPNRTSIVIFGHFQSIHDWQIKTWDWPIVFSNVKWKSAAQVVGELLPTPPLLRTKNLKFLSYNDWFTRQLSHVISATSSSSRRVCTQKMLVRRCENGRFSSVTAYVTQLSCLKQWNSKL